MEIGGIQEIFLKSLKGPLSDLLGLEDEAIYSFYIDQTPIQDSFRYRAKYLGLRIATLIIDEMGELKRDVVLELIQLLNQTPFILGPSREGDVLLISHIQKCLNALIEKKEIWPVIRKFSLPLCHKKAEEVIRETLWPEPIKVLRAVHVRKAALASWLTLLRQSTGSCFATAPAIFVQQNLPLQFFKDLYDLLSLGQMRRVFGGKEFSVPLSFNLGVGDLHKIVGTSFFGLLFAMDVAGVKLTKEKERFIREKGPQRVDLHLRDLLLEDAGLSLNDLKDEEHLSRIQMTPLLAKQGVVYHRALSDRAQKVAEWKMKFEKACTAFKSITECSLLRSWEYSIASFCDVKTEFSRWNLYIGLGLHPDQKNGIGAFLYDELNLRLKRCHEEIEHLRKEYEYEYQAVQALEVMIQGTANDMRLSKLKAEWMSHISSLNSIAETRNRLIAKADAMVGLFTWLLEQYDEKLQEFFQELFDPVLSRETGHVGPMYDDSPAGFRLVYKHGLKDASKWSAVFTEEEYVRYLRDFFSRAENELEPPPGIEKEFISELTTALIQFIQRVEFIEGAIARSKEHGRLSPWDYISGGTLQTLLMAYCNRSHPFTEKSIVPQSTEELMQFFTGFEKSGPYLMHSPTHAFIFYPELISRYGLLKAKPCPKWSDAMQEHLAHKLSERLDETERALFLHVFRQKHSANSNLLFRQNLIEALGNKKLNQETIVDSFLYENTVLLGPTEGKEVLEKILGRSVSSLFGSFFGSFDLYTLAKELLLKAKGNVFFSENWDQKIVNELLKLKILPQVQLFADTNWSSWTFGFVHHPVTSKLELWRFNQTATRGFPMTDWKDFASASNKLSWVVLSKVEEYFLL